MYLAYQLSFQTGLLPLPDIKSALKKPQGGKQIFPSGVTGKVVIDQSRIDLEMVNVLSFIDKLEKIEIGVYTVLPLREVHIRRNRRLRQHRSET
jgi:hypothetical protein